MTHRPRNRLITLVCLGGSLLLSSSVFLVLGGHGVGQDVAGRSAKNEQGLIKRVEDLERRLVPPVGAILAWHRDVRIGNSVSLPSQPLELPSGWMECDGSPIPEGPLKGLITPKLNNVEGSHQGGRFLRGSTKSGEYQEATALFSQWEGASNGSGVAVPGDNNQFAMNADGDSAPPSGNFGDAVKPDKPGIASPAAKYVFTRPINMSIIYIMRIY